MFLLILIIIIIVSKKQDLNIFKYYNSKYICNTHIKIDSNNLNPIKIIFQIKNRLSTINYFNNDINSLNKFIYVKKKSHYLEELNTKKLLLWRFIIYNDNNKLLLVFQNHRSLCGGQERIWKIINYILDEPIIPIKNKKKINMNTYAFTNYLNFLKYNSLIQIPLILNSNRYDLNKTKYFMLKKFNLTSLKHFCKKYNCSINDFAISYNTYFLIKNQQFLNQYINVFIPIYLENEYTYYILRIPTNFSNFYELLNYVKIITIKSLKNPLIKYNTFLNTRLIQILPNEIYLKMYEKILSKIDIFISNIPGFSIQRTFLGYPIENIYQVYNSYNCAIESGISSYSDTLTLSMNINDKFK